MPKGDRYVVGGTLGVYTTASDAINRRNKASDLKDNWNSVEGNGTPYINNFSGWGNYHPAVPIWWIPSWGGGGYEIGWVNDNDNYQATTPSVSPATTTMGNTMTISLPRNHSSIYHVVEYDFYGVKGTISSNAGTSASWTPNVSLADKIPNATTGTGTITAKTYGGGRLVGTKTCSFKLSVPSTVVPTLSHVVSEGVSGIATKFGAYIQNHSKIKVVNTASGARSSTIKTIVTTIENKNYNGASITSGFISRSGQVSVKTVATDSRGRTATKTTTVSVSAYSPPKIARFTGFRSNSAGTQLDDGTFLQVSQKFSITPLNDYNSAGWEVEYKKVNASTWSQVASGSVYSYDSAFTSSTAILDTQYSYDIRLTVSDYFSSATLTIMVGTAFDYISISVEGKGVAIGKVSEKPNTFEVALPTEFSDSVKVDGSDIATETALSALRDDIYDDSGSYRGIKGKGGYIRTPSAGIIPESTSSDGVGNVGTSGWPFKNGYFANSVVIKGNAAWHNGTVTSSKAANGYIRFPNGVIIQWGNQYWNAADINYRTITYPIAFPSTCVSISGSFDITSNTAEDDWYAYATTFSNITRTSARVRVRAGDDNKPPGNVRGYVRWIAIGY